MFNFSIACLIVVIAYATYCKNDLPRLLSQDDDRGDFTELYNRYWKKLFAIASSRLKERETAKDIVHDILPACGKAGADLHFTGGLSRSETVRIVFKKLELTGEVKFKTEGRKIIGSP